MGHLSGLTDAERQEHVRRQGRESYARNAGTRRRMSKRHDPLLTISPVDLAYIAGLVDGEGTICCLAHKNAKTCYPMVSIVMTDFAVIEWVAGKWAVTRSTHQRNQAYLRQAIVRLSGERAILFCRLLLPYLKVKHRQAELVQSFPMEGRGGPGRKLDADMNARRMALRDKVNGLNLRPRNSTYRRGVAQ